MGIFRRIWNLTLDSLNIPHEEEAAPRRWYGVPPPAEDDLIHKYCTGQVDVTGREIPEQAPPSDKYTRGQIKASPEELNSLLSQYGSTEEKSAVSQPETSPVKPDGTYRIMRGESTHVSAGVPSVTTIVPAQPFVGNIHTGPIPQAPRNDSEQVSYSASVERGTRAPRADSVEDSVGYKERVGAEFEEEVVSMLEGVAAIYGGEVYSGLVIPRDDKDAEGQVNTSQLDALVVLPTYIVVVECKNWAGTVYVNYDQDRNWVVVSNGGRSYRQYSPTRQNGTHIRTLSRYLGIDPTHFASAVVFSNRGQLRKVPQATHHSFIGDGEQLANYIGILAMSGYTEVPYLELAKTKLRMLQRTSEYSTGQQRAAMRNRVERNICPSCGHPLLIRKSRRTGNRFYGCSMYPQCKYTREIT